MASRSAAATSNSPDHPTGYLHRKDRGKSSGNVFIFHSYLASHHSALLHLVCYISPDPSSPLIHITDAAGRVDGANNALQSCPPQLLFDISKIDIDATTGLWTTADHERPLRPSHAEVIARLYSIRHHSSAVSHRPINLR